MRNYDAVILESLSKGLSFDSMLANLSRECDIWCSVCDLNFAYSHRSPATEPHIAALEELRCRIVNGCKAGEKTATALMRDGKTVAFEPQDNSSRSFICGMLSAQNTLQNLIFLTLPDNSSSSEGIELINRLNRVYEYLQGSASASPVPREANYLEERLSRELIFGEGDVSHSIFGNLSELRLEGSPGGIVPNYAFALLYCADDVELPNLCRALSRLLPKSFLLTSNYRLYCFLYGLDETQLESAVDKLKYFSSLNSLTCALTESFSSLSERCGYRAQAECLLDIALCDTSGGLTRASEHYFELIVAGAALQVGKSVLELSEIATLAEYDEQNGTDYLATLEAYLSHGNRLSASSASIFVDRSTMKYRLQKIADILGTDLDTSANAKRLSLGLALHKMPEK